MSPTENPPQPVPVPVFQDLGARADKGELGVAPGVARSAAESAASTHNRIAEIVKGISGQLTPKKFGDIKSGTTLSMKFDNAATTLMTALDTHQKILNDMGDAFLRAGKLYNAAEGDSKMTFDVLKSKPYSGKKISEFKIINWGRGDWHEKEYGGFHDKHYGDRFKPLDGLIARTEGKDSSPITTENEYDYGGQWFTDLRKNIDYMQVQTAGDKWKWAGEELKVAFDDLTNSLTQMRNRNLWTGNGFDKALESIGNYQTQVAGFTTDLTSMSENITFASYWLENTTHRMPYSWKPGDENTKNGARILQEAQLGFRIFYKKGISDSNSAIPFLSMPVNPIQMVTPPPKPIEPPGKEAGTPGPPGPPGTPARMNTQALQTQQAALNKQQEALRQQAIEQQQRIAQEQKAAEQRATDQRARDQAVQQGQQQGQQGLDKAMQAGQQGLQAAQQALQDKAKDLAAGLSTVPAGLNSALSAAMDKGAGGPGGKGGPGAGMPGSPLSRDAVQAAKLFPRAGVDPAIAAAAAAGRAGAAPMAGMPGAPGAMGAGAHGAGGQNKDHKRPEYLESVEYLQEALGEAPKVAKPVVEK